MWGFIGIFVLCCGIYALYSFVIMKVKGEINASILLGKDYTYKKCKDKEAYIAKTAPALFVFGLEKSEMVCGLDYWQGFWTHCR